MIRRGTVLDVSDNSGAKLVKCVGIYGGTNHSFTSQNDVIKICIKKLDRKKKVKKKEMYKALIISTKKRIRRNDGTVLRFDKNRALIFSDQLKFLGTRIRGPINQELRKLPLFKQLISYTEVIL